jgi:hypothetical protein
LDPTVVHAERPVGILATAAPGAATAIVNLGKALTEWADTAAALDTGSIGVGHAKVIVGFFARLPDGVPAEALPECETYLLQAAAGENPAELARRAAALRHLLEPIQDSLPDAENTDLNELFAATTLGGRGMVKADLDAETMEMLHAALSALSEPQPGEDGARDTRSPALRRAEAFAELLRRHLIPRRQPRGMLRTSARVVPHPGRRPHRRRGHRAARSTRRIACDCELTPIRIDGQGVPLNLGRSQRLVSPGQRRALIARDHGCAFPGCNRPPPGPKPTTSSTESTAARQI